MVLLQATDAETIKFMRNKGVDAEDYTAMKHYIETSFLEEQEVKPVERKSISTVDEGQDGEKGWEQWGAGTQDLDSFKGSKGGKWGKGKSDKGKGKGGHAQCYRCQGFGHLARDCPTPEGSTEQHICLSCGGAGHFARDHQQSSGAGLDSTKGKGEGEESWKGKGKGKGVDKGKGKGTYGKGWNKGWGKGKGKRCMSSMDGAQFATMENSDCNGYGYPECNEDWTWGWGPENQVDSFEERAPWDKSQEPSGWMSSPAGSAWGWVSSIAHKSQPPMRNMTTSRLTRLTGLSSLAPVPARTETKNRFEISEDKECICCSKRSDPSWDEEETVMIGNVMIMMKSEIVKSRAERRQRKTKQPARG